MLKLNTENKFITNYQVSLESIVAQAITKAGKVPDLIVNRDAAGNINTGIMFIRCSEMGRKAMMRIRELQISHAHNRLVDMWDSNGCIMLLNKEIEFREVSGHVPSFCLFFGFCLHDVVFAFLFFIFYAFDIFY